MKFRDLKAQYNRYKQDIDNAIEDVLLNGQFIGGSTVTTLENRLAEYIGVKHCISCANGTEAMTLLMMAWNIGEGDAVFVPDFTFFSTGEIVSFVGATPVFVDVDPDTFNMNIDSLINAIERVLDEGVLKPKVIIPVDLFGLPADYIKLEKIAFDYKLKLLGDSAQGFGSSINGKKSSAFGDASTTSFFPAKPLGCYGDGGAIFTNSSELADLLKSLKVHGKGDNKYDNIRIGVNSRLDTIQAAILGVKLTAFIDHELEDVNNVYHWYTNELKDVVKTPYIPENYVSSFAQYTIVLENKETRDGLQKYLHENDIPSMIYYIKPMHKQEAFGSNYKSYTSLDNTIKLADTVLSLPMHPYLSKDDVELVCKYIKNYICS